MDSLHFPAELNAINSEKILNSLLDKSRPGGDGSDAAVKAPDRFASVLKAFLHKEGSKLLRFERGVNGGPESVINAEYSRFFTATNLRPCSKAFHVFEEILEIPILRIHAQIIPSYPGKSTPSPGRAKLLFLQSRQTTRSPSRIKSRPFFCLALKLKADYAYNLDLIVLT